MFWQRVKGALIRQRGRFILIALTVALGVSLATAMLNVMFDIGEKVNQELKAFGANIVVTPRNSMVLIWLNSSLPGITGSPWRGAAGST